jgi:hypothetical protein
MQAFKKPNICSVAILSNQYTAKGHKIHPNYLPPQKPMEQSDWVLSSDHGLAMFVMAPQKYHSLEPIKLSKLIKFKLH